MNSESDYINYFNFLKNLKNQPDNGLSPLMEWRYAILFFAKVVAYLACEWDVYIEKILDTTGCSFDNYPVLFRHRQSVAEIVVEEFRNRGNVSNAAFNVLEYLRINGLYNPPSVE